MGETGLTLEGRNRTATSLDEITVAAVADGTLVTYRATITFHGITRLADPLMQVYFNRLGDRTIVSIGAALAQRA